MMTESGILRGMGFGRSIGNKCLKFLLHKKRGGVGLAIRNFPQVQEPELEAGEMATQIRQALQLKQLPEIDTTDADQVRERIDQYFEFCIQNDCRPHVEGLALAVGVTRQTLWNWRNSGKKRGQIVDQAVQLICSLTESWGITGKLNPACFCFVMKNHFGWKDNITVEAVPANYHDVELSPEEIEMKIAEDIPEDTADPVGVVEILNTD